MPLMGNTLESFEQSAKDASATVEVVHEADLNNAILSASEPPVVGTALRNDDIEFPDEINTDPNRRDLTSAKTGVTRAIGGIAEYGSLLLRIEDSVSEYLSLLPDRHVIVIKEGDIVPVMDQAIEIVAPLFREERADIIVATGPSGTADMGEFVQGAHGPSEVHIIVVRETGR